MENKMTIEEILSKLSNASFGSLISRKYVPIKEKRELLDNALTILFGRFEETELVEMDAYQESDMTLDDLFIKSAIIGSYIDIDVSDKMAIYDTFMENKLYESLLDFVPDAKEFDRIFKSRIEEKREFIKVNYMNNQSYTLTDLVTKLVKKEIEVQDLQKKVLEQTEKINSQYNKEEITNMTNVFAEVNKLSQNPDYLLAVADAIHKENSKKKPQDHKKSKKTSTINFVNNEFSKAEIAVMNADNAATVANNASTKE